MFFLSPWFLPALAAAAAPLVLHLLHRKKPRIMPWAAMRFLLADESRKSRTSLRLKDILLLLLRMLAVSALVLFFARPMVAGGHSAAGARDVIVVVDTSLSMSGKSGAGTAWGYVLTQAKQALEGLGTEDFVRILTVSEAPQWLTKSALQATDEGKVQAAVLLDSLKPGQGGCRLTNGLSEAILARPAKEGLVRRVVVLTDGQAATLQPDAAAAWAGLKDAARALPGGCVVEVITPPPEGTPPNLAVTRSTVSREQAAAGDLLLFRAHIKNFGPADAGPVSIRWSIDGAPAGLNTVSALKPGAERSAEFTRACPPGPGTTVVQCDLEAPGSDALPGDNSAAVLVETMPPVSVLLIDGSRARDAKTTDTGWIEAALGKTNTPGDGETSGFAVTSLPVSALKPEELRNFQAVILANIPLLGTAAVEALENYVREGGGLWIMPGGKTMEAGAAFGKALYRDGQGLSPLLWTLPKGAEDNPEAAVKVRVPSLEHPVTKFLRDARRTDAGSVRIYRRFLFDPPPQETQVLLTLEDGAPFLAEKSFGAGRVLVQGGPFNLMWGDWPKHHAFVVLLHEGLWRLASSGLVRWNLAAGEALAWPVPSSLTGDTVPVLRPDGHQVEARIEQRGRQRMAVITDTAEPGMYVLAPGLVDERKARFLVQRNEEESNLRPASAAEREGIAQAGGLVFTAAALSEAAGKEVQRYSPAWALCAALAGIFLCAESLLASWLLRRRHQPAKAALTLGGAS
jgi:hypothetical protein